MKRRDPAHDITVVERNRPGDTFGWGVVFSDRTQSHLRDADPAALRGLAGQLFAPAAKLLARTDRIYPQFATHNAHTLASIMHYAGSRRDYEFQRLHGMGEELYAASAYLSREPILLGGLKGQDTVKFIAGGFADRA